MRLERSMALEESRLTRNLANLKNRETAKNKFLKTKAKIQEFKQNFLKPQITSKQIIKVKKTLKT